MKALQILTELDYQVKRDLYQNVPLHAVPRGKFLDKTGNGLTQCILTWLKLHHHYAVRINTTGRKLKDTTIIDIIGKAHVTPGKWIPGTTRKGTADIHAVLHGKHCSIEIKIGYDRMSKDQERTKQDVERAGGCYFIAKDFETFLEWYKNITQN